MFGLIFSKISTTIFQLIKMIQILKNESQVISVLFYSISLIIVLAISILQKPELESEESTFTFKYYSEFAFFFFIFTG